MSTASMQQKSENWKFNSLGLTFNYILIFLQDYSLLILFASFTHTVTQNLINYVDFPVLVGCECCLNHLRARLIISADWHASRLKLKNCLEFYYAGIPWPLGEGILF